MLHITLFFFIYISGFILSFTSNPAFSFVLYETVYFFYPDNRWWGNMMPVISYSFYTVMLMMAIYISKFKSYNVNKILSVPQFIWMYIILILFGIANFYAIDPDRHYNAFIVFLKLAVIVTVAYKIIDTDNKLNLSIWGYLFGAWYISFYIWQFGRNSGARVERMGTVDSPDANGLAAAIAPALVLSLHYFLVTKSIHVKLLFVIAGVFIANAIVLINSRGAFLGVALSLFYYMYYLYFSAHKKSHQKKIAIFITVAGLLGSVYLADESFIQRMSTIDDNLEVDESRETGGTRMIFWSAAWEMTKDYPFGNGYKGFNYLAHLYIPAGVATGRTVNRTVHSTWMEALTEIGYAGLIALVFMLWSSYKTSNKCKHALASQGDLDNYFKVIALQAAGICFIISMTFLNRLRAEILYWLILYSAVAYNIYILKPSVEKRKKDSTT